MQGADEANKIKTQEIFSMEALERRVWRAALMMETIDSGNQCFSNRAGIESATSPVACLLSVGNHQRLKVISFKRAHRRSIAEDKRQDKICYYGTGIRFFKGRTCDCDTATCQGVSSAHSLRPPHVLRTSIHSTMPPPPLEQAIYLHASALRHSYIQIPWQILFTKPLPCSPY